MKAGFSCVSDRRHEVRPRMALRTLGPTGFGAVGLGVSLLGAAAHRGWDLRRPGRGAVRTALPGARVVIERRHSGSNSPARGAVFAGAAGTEGGAALHHTGLSPRLRGRGRVTRSRLRLRPSLFWGVHLNKGVQAVLQTRRVHRTATAHTLLSLGIF